MNALKRLLEEGTSAPPITTAEVAQPQPPVQAESMIERAEDTPTLKTQEEPSDFESYVLEEMGHDPNLMMIAGSIKTWGNADGMRYSAPVVPRATTAIDTDDLLDKVFQFLPSGSEVEAAQGTALESQQTWRTIQVGDVHVGKSYHDGAGSNVLVERFVSAVTTAINDVPSTHTGIHLAVLGDLIEGEASQNGKNIAMNDLQLTAQIRLAVSMFIRAVTDAVAKTGNVIVSIVPGNHGDTNRTNARNATENFDVLIVSLVQEFFNNADELNGNTVFADSIKWVYPVENEMHITYPVGDTIFSSVHGHKFGRGSNAMDKACKWWGDFSFNNRPEGQSNVLMAGHFHTMQIRSVCKGRTVMFSPALEDQSTWLAESTGQYGSPGVLVYDTDSRRQPFNISVISGND